MKKSKLDSPPVKAEVVKRLAAGESQSSIAEGVGLHRSQLCRFANRQDIKEFIEQEQLRLLEVVPDAVENQMELVREMKNIPPKETKRRELAYKASQDVLKAVGIMPTPLQSPVITNIFQNPLDVINGPYAREVIEKYLRPYPELSDPDYQDEKETIAEDPEETPPPLLEN